MRPLLKLKMPFILTFIFGALFVQAQVAYSVKSFNMKIEGTSTLHDWTSDVL
jgi:hypothetical protein